MVYFTAEKPPFLLAKKRLVLGVSVITALSVALVFALCAAGKDAWWYNTLLLFPLGMWFGLAKPRIDVFLLSFCASVAIKVRRSSPSSSFMVQMLSSVKYTSTPIRFSFLVS